MNSAIQTIGALMYRLQVENAVLAITNDGNGDQCGYTYNQRCALANIPEINTRERSPFLEMAANFSTWLVRHGGIPLDNPQTKLVAEDVYLYYVEHLKECSLHDRLDKGPE